LIIANNIPFSQLIPPSQVEFHYLKEIYPDNFDQRNGKQYRKYLLLEKKNLSKETLTYLTNKKASNNLNVCFEDEEFVFLMLGA